MKKDMNYSKAIELLHPKTYKKAIRELELKYDFDNEKVSRDINKACIIACDLMRQYERLTDKSINKCQNCKYYHSLKMSGEDEATKGCCIFSSYENMHEPTASVIEVKPNHMCINFEPRPE